MAKKTPAPAINHALLTQIAAETAKPGGYMHVSEADAKPLVAAGLIEVNPDPQFANAQGHKAARASTAGMAAAATAPADAASTPATAPAVAAAKPSFAIVSGVPMPESQRRGAVRTEQYPFSKLEVGQSFFIPATADKPQPERSYASTLASARARYAKVDPSGATRTNRKNLVVPVQVYERDFAIRGNVDGTPYGMPGTKGAGIFRIK